VSIFGRGNQGRKNRYGRKNDQQRKADNGSRISKNPVERKFEFTQSGVLFGHS
jgi:hypothetical protein